jgi:hypothetical protein
LGFLLSEVVSYGGDSPYSTPYAEDNDPIVDPEVLDPETCGSVAYEPELCGPVTCEPVVTETGGPEICVTVVCYGLT